MDEHLPDGVLSTEGLAQRVKPRALTRGDRVRVDSPDEAASYPGIVTELDGLDRVFVYDAGFNVAFSIPLAWVTVVEAAPRCCPTCGREVTP